MTKKRAFMVLPFNDPVANSAYQSCVVPVCQEHDLEIRNAGELFNVNVIYEDIRAEIDHASVIIVDVSGKNPNVFYELGVAHALKQDRTIILTHDGHDKTPFDIAHFRILAYQDSIDGVAALRKGLTRTIDALLQDLETIHEEQFAFLMRVLSAAEMDNAIMAVVGLSQCDKPVYANAKFTVTGEYQRGLGSQMCAWASQVFKTFVAMKYVDTTGGIVSLTELGRAFANYARSCGVVCHQINDETLTPGFVPPWDSLDPTPGVTVPDPSSTDVAAAETDAPAPSPSEDTSDD